MRKLVSPLTLIKLLLAVFLSAMSVNGFSQESPSLPDSIVSLSPAFLTDINKKISLVESGLDAHSKKILKRMERIEQRLQRKLAKRDSSSAKDLFNGVEDKYKQLLGKAQYPGKTGTYLPYLDTLKTSLQFLKQDGSAAALGKEKLDGALKNMNVLESQFQKAGEIKKFIKERRRLLEEQLGKLRFVRELKKMSKEAYYYGQRVNEYKELIKDSKKAERKAIELLSKTKLFKDFMRKNSDLAALFRMPGDPNDPTTQANLAGLQTRTQVNNIIQQQLGAGGPGATQQFRQNLQDAQSQLNEMKNKILKAGGTNSDAEMPDFKPNPQKTKSFFQRLEYGTNIQTKKAQHVFPVTSDIALSVGYKLNDKSIIGIGSSFKMGWGTGWKNIRISSQGVGIRSFIDYKIKGSFWISGGFEMNYLSQVNSIAQLRDYSAWQQSGLLGISKKISLKTKFFKNTKLQVLWDFLSYKQMPVASPLVFRVGYNF